MIQPLNARWRRSGIRGALRQRQFSAREDRANDGFTVSELLIALLVIALAVAGLSAMVSLYSRQMYRTEVLASTVRQQANVEQILESFISAATRSPGADWDCTRERVRATCTGPDGLGACSLSLRKAGRAWHLALERGDDVEAAGPFLARSPQFQCGWTLSSEGWTADPGATTIVMFLDEGVDRAPWVSAGDN